MEEGSAEVPKRTEVQPRLELVDLRQRFEDKFNQVFQGQQISVDILFAYHETPKDIEGLVKRFKDSDFDIYIPESFGWKPQYLEAIRDASSGRNPRRIIASLGEEVSRSFRKKLEIIRGSRKAITIIDVPDGHDLVRKSDETSDYIPLMGEFTEVLDYTRDFLNNYANFQKEREQYMLDQVDTSKVEELFRRYRWLRNKPTMKILLDLGRSHGPMPSDYSTYSFMDEGIIKSKFDQPVDDELAAKIYLESFIEGVVSKGQISLRYWLTEDSQKIDEIKRLIVSKLSYEDAPRIFNYIKKKGIPPRNEFDRIFDEREIRTQELIDAFLAKPVSPQNQNSQG